VYLPFAHTHLTADSPTYLAAGQALLDGSYSTPIGANMYYTQIPGGWVDRTMLHLPQRVWDAPERQTFRTPAYPLVIAATGGGSGLSRYLLYLVQGLMVGLSVFVLVQGLALITTPTVALLAGALYALDPFSKRYALLVMTEATTALLVTVAFYFFARAVRRHSLGSWAASGAAAAAATLARPIFIMLVPLLLLAAIVFEKGHRPLAALAALGASIIVLTPWLIWTTNVTGTPALATFTEGMALLEGAWGQGLDRTTAVVESDPRFLRQMYSVHRFAPSPATLIRDPKAHARYLDRADKELRRLALKRYRMRLSDDPLGVAWNVAYRSYFIWMAHEDWYQPPGGPLLLALRLADWVALGLAVLGGVVAGRRFGGAAACIPLFLLVYTVLLAFHVTEARFGIPVRGLYLSLAAIGMLEAASAFRRVQGGIPQPAA
jgi:hypothetical protein